MEIGEIPGQEAAGLLSAALTRPRTAPTLHKATC